MRYQYVKKKGYVRLHTNKGDLNLELHCDKVMTTTHIQPYRTNTTKQAGGGGMVLDATWYWTMKRVHPLSCQV